MPIFVAQLQLGISLIVAGLLLIFDAPGVCVFAMSSAFSALRMLISVAGYALGGWNTGKYVAGNDVGANWSKPVRDLIMKFIPPKKSERGYAFGARYGVRGGIFGGILGMLLAVLVFFLFGEIFVFSVVPLFSLIGFYVRRIVPLKGGGQSGGGHVLW